MPRMKSPLARDRSFRGNHRLTIALDIGKWIPSAMPRRNRSAARARTVAPKVEEVVRTGVGAPKASEKGYGARERDAVDDLVEKTR